MMSDVSLVTSPDGTPEYTIVLVADVTERIKLEERLEYQAFHDPLTQLANRARLHDLLEQAWERAASPASSRCCSWTSTGSSRSTTRSATRPATSCSSLVARRLERSVRAGDAVARFGGDEFVVVCENIAEPRRGAADRGPHPREPRPHLPAELR